MCVFCMFDSRAFADWLVFGSGFAGWSVSAREYCTGRSFSSLLIPVRAPIGQFLVLVALISRCRLSSFPGLSETL